MATKTPPGLGGQTRTQYQRNWGNFASETDVPNGATNAISAPEFLSLIHI